MKKLNLRSFVKSHPDYEYVFESGSMFFDFAVYFSSFVGNIWLCNCSKSTFRKVIAENPDMKYLVVR